MADPHVSDSEKFEYGEHFLRESQRLVGASPLVDVALVRADVQAALAAMERELGAVGVSRDDLGGKRVAITPALDRALATADRFHSHLGSLDPEEEPFSMDAFFPGGRKGEWAGLKPADVSARLGDLLRGFDVPANAALPDAKRWQKKLGDAKTALDDALAGRGGSTGASIRSTAGLAAAREAWETAYQGVAKHLVRGLLRKLGRAAEVDQFFLDLQVHEEPRPTDVPAAPPSTGVQPT